MAIGCGVAAATVYVNQLMLSILQAAFPGRGSVAGFVPVATQLGFAVGLLLLVARGNRIDRRSLIVLQLAALALSLAAAALAPDAWALVVISALIGMTSPLQRFWSGIWLVGMPSASSAPLWPSSPLLTHGVLRD
jgi:predicted MFS family arabinose efflux permease